jgi:hypothetical protein
MALYAGTGAVNSLTSHFNGVEQVTPIIQELSLSSDKQVVNTIRSEHRTQWDISRPPVVGQDDRQPSLRDTRRSGGVEWNYPRMQFWSTIRVHRSGEKAQHRSPKLKLGSPVRLHSPPHTYSKDSGYEQDGTDNYGLASFHR